MLTVTVYLIITASLLFVIPSFNTSFLLDSTIISNKENKQIKKLLNLPEHNSNFDAKYLLIQQLARTKRSDPNLMRWSKKSRTVEVQHDKKKLQKWVPPNLIIIPILIIFIFFGSIFCKCCTWIKQDIREHDAKVNNILSNSLSRLEYTDRLEESEKKWRERKNLKVVHQLPDFMYQVQGVKAASSSSSDTDSSVFLSRHRRNRKSYAKSMRAASPEHSLRVKNSKLRRVASVNHQSQIRRIPSNNSSVPSACINYRSRSPHFFVPDYDKGIVTRFSVSPHEESPNRTAQWVSSTSTHTRKVFRILSVEEYDDVSACSQCSTCGRSRMTKRLSNSMGNLHTTTPTHTDDSGCFSPSASQSLMARKEHIPPIQSSNDLTMIQRRRPQSCRRIKFPTEPQQQFKKKSNESKVIMKSVTLRNHNEQTKNDNNSNLLSLPPDSTSLTNENWSYSSANQLSKSTIKNNENVIDLTNFVANKGTIEISTELSNSDNEQSRPASVV